MRGFSKKAYKKKSRYGNVKVVYNGIKFDSIGESHCYQFYELQQRAGEIAELKTQPKTYLTDAKILYKPDLVFKDLKTGKIVYVDYKGRRTTAFQIKRRLWKYYGPGTLILCDGYGLNIRIIETIIPVGKQ